SCGDEGHFARDCPEPRKDGGGLTGECFNCGEVGHNKADCTNPRVEREFTGTCNGCGAQGHRKAECPVAPPRRCKVCHQDGHVTSECSANRMHEMFKALGIQDISPEEAWAALEAADKEKDVDDIKNAIFAYTKAYPALTFEDLEQTFRDASMNTFIIAKEQTIADTHTIVNLQGKSGMKYVVSYQFSDKPKRAKFAEGWPASKEDNRIRLAEAGVVMDGLVPKCSNCQQLGHIAKNCEQEKQEPAGKVVITCAVCNAEGHRARDCTQERKSDKRGCKNCGSEDHMVKECPTKAPDVCRNCGEEGHRKTECTNERQMQCRNCDKWGHASRDCPEPKNMDKVQCRNCDEFGHNSRDCPQPTDWSRVECSNCHEKGHTYKRCTKPAGKEDSGAGGDGGWGGDDAGASSGGNGGGWEQNAAPAASSGGW
ncbi:uncharacterized protein MYCFIDRAFT_136456, partial [Pseudocercospora fijiensis CIRAD86]